MTALQIYEIFKTETSFWGVIIILVLSFIQFSKIELHPLDKLMKAIGRSANKELHDKVDSIEKSVNKMSEELEKEIEIRKIEKLLAAEAELMKDAEAARRRFLHFNDELLTRSLKHSKESFDETLDDITLYENYCKSHKDYENNKATLAIQNIRKVYAKCCDDKDFL